MIPIASGLRRARYRPTRIEVDLRAVRGCDPHLREVAIDHFAGIRRRRGASLRSFLFRLAVLAAGLLFAALIRWS